MEHGTTRGKYYRAAFDWRRLFRMVKIDLEFLQSNVKMEPIHPDEMVPDTKYTMEDRAAVSLAELLSSVDEMVQKITGESQSTNRSVKKYKTVTFKRVAYKNEGVWYYQFDVDGRKQYFTENDAFYKEA